MIQFLTAFTVGGCDSLERTDFLQFVLGEYVVVYTKTHFNSVYFGMVWWS